MNTFTKVLKHFKTICQHKFYVFQECRACGLTWRGIVHDLSKFTPTEFIPSAKHFQGDRSPCEAEAEEFSYSKAWLHHKGHNPHHWEYWTDFNNDGTIKVNKIPYDYVVEMVCDWIGAGKAYSKDKWNIEEPIDYYYKVREGRHIHPQTEILIIKFLKCIRYDGLDEFHRMANDFYLKSDYEGWYIP